MKIYFANGKNCDIMLFRKLYIFQYQEVFTMKNPYLKKFLIILGAMCGVGLLICGLVIICASYGLLGDINGVDVESLTLNTSSAVYYIDENGEEVFLDSLSSNENRVWVDKEEIPQHMLDAFVAIEDERFYSHNGFDLFRTTKAVFVHFFNKITNRPTTFGGSTITQQLIKNITMDREQTSARKIREISQSVNLERHLSKDQILEMYVNTIYLANGCSGIQTASYKYFGKPVSELNIAESACIAGITQAPTTYDPLHNPENNKKKQEIVLKKMLELDYITEEEYNEAVNYKLVFKEKAVTATADNINSYFIDEVIEQVLADLIEEGYPEVIAEKLLYTGGLKIISTYDPNVQNAIDSVYADKANFPNTNMDPMPQSSIIVIDPYNGEIKGMAGGIGEKTGDRILNRATGTFRQPGSTIKPIAVYSPALEAGIVTPGTIYEDKAIDYNGWVPKNYDFTYRGPMTVRNGLRNSVNTIAVQVLDDLGTHESFDHLVNNLGVTSLVKSRTIDGKVYSDINLSSLALGGLTDGISLMELTAAYQPFVNSGIYTKPHIYKSVYDSKGKEILYADEKTTEALSPSTAYVTTQMLRAVVTSGTGGGAQLSNASFTAGKTGTTSDMKDRWFVGFTPNYVCGVWYGWDIPRTIPGGNPCVSTFKTVMDKVHEKVTEKTIKRPKDVIEVTYCKESGKPAGDNCGENVETFWFVDNKLAKEKCKLPHGESTIIVEVGGEVTEDTNSSAEIVIE